MTPDPIDVPAAVAGLKALANPGRLRIALLLLGGEKNVGQIEAELGLRQPGLSQHLAELRDAGLVTARREARHVFYGLSDDRARAVLSALAGRPASAAPAPRTRSQAVFAAAFASVDPRA